jgi:hypothetical protein
MTAKNPPKNRLSGLLVQPIASRIQGWLTSGKLDEDDLDRALPGIARDWVDHGVAASDWAPLEDVERLIDLAAAQLGGETGLVEWADEIVSEWLLESDIESLVGSARRLVDGSGYVVSQMSERLVQSAEWRYEGGRTGFSVRLCGVAELSLALKSLIGACLAQLATAADEREVDARFEGVDAAELVIFGELEAALDGGAESRLHRAALIG